MTDLTRAALPEPLLTDDARDEEFNALSRDDCGHIAAYVSSQFPAVFDHALRELKRYPSPMEDA